MLTFVMMKFGDFVTLSNIFYLEDLLQPAKIIDILTINKILMTGVRCYKFSICTNCSMSTAVHVWGHLRSDNDNQLSNSMAPSWVVLTPRSKAFCTARCNCMFLKKR